MPDAVSPVPYDHWPRYAELTELLQAWAAQRPDLVEIVSIGRSHEGRDIWMCEVTDRSTGRLVSPLLGARLIPNFTDSLF